jgi:hypothetical protein
MITETDIGALLAASLRVAVAGAGPAPDPLRNLPRWRRRARLRQAALFAAVVVAVVTAIGVPTALLADRPAAPPVPASSTR